MKMHSIRNEYEVGQKFMCAKEMSFRNTEDELIDVFIGDSFSINDVSEGSDHSIVHYFVIFDGSDLECRLTKEELDEVTSNY